MIDHISIGVSDLDKAGRFYDAVLAPVGLTRLIVRDGTLGYGKKYGELWLNMRADMGRVAKDTGSHVCFRAPDVAAVDAFYAAALAGGGSDDGPPGPRPEYHATYYGAFVRDLDGNRIEAVTFVSSGN